MRVFNKMVKMRDLHVFTIWCGDSKVIKQVPEADLGFWAKLSLGWWDEMEAEGDLELEIEDQPREKVSILKNGKRS